MTLALTIPTIDSETDCREQDENLAVEQTAADHLVAAMERFGIRTAFGVTGGAIGTIFDRLSTSSIYVVQSQHEGAAAYAAMGRAMASDCRELPVCFSTSGPGITNLLTGVAAAYEEGVPMLVLTGNSSSQIRYAGALQDSSPGGIDAIRMFDSITVANRTLQRAEDLVPLFYRLAEASLRHKKPVHLNVPLDLSNVVLGSSYHHSVRIHRGALCSEDLKLLRRFLAAKRPVIFAGNGIKLSGCTFQLTNVANFHRIPVVTTTHGRGSVSEYESCFFGTFGFASDGSGKEFLTAYAPDAILFLGTGLGEMSTGGWSPLLGAPDLRIHVDLDPAKFNRKYTMYGVIENDLQAVLSYLSECTPSRTHFPVTPRISMIVPRIGGNGSGNGVHPGNLFKSLSGRLDGRCAIFADIGNAIAWAFRDLELREEQKLFVPLGLSSMGSALGAALGAATFWKDRAVLCICGDCAALMHGSELKTAAEYGIPLKVIVLNDGGPGMVHHGSRMIGLNNSHLRFQTRVDFEGYAKALGLCSFQVRDNEEWSGSTLELAMQQPVPTLLDIWIDPAVEPPIADRARVLGQTESRVG